MSTTLMKTTANQTAIRMVVTTLVSLIIINSVTNKTPKFTRKLTNHEILRFMSVHNSYSSERLAGRAFLTLGVFAFLAFAAFTALAGLATAVATFALATALATGFLSSSEAPPALSNSPIFVTLPCTSH